VGASNLPGFFFVRGRSGSFESLQWAGPKVPEESPWTVIPQTGNFAFQTDARNVVRRLEEDISGTPGSLSLEKSPRNTRPIYGKTDTPTPLNVHLSIAPIVREGDRRRKRGGGLLLRRGKVAHFDLHTRDFIPLISRASEIFLTPLDIPP
jgi:hypothetical protein